jgi:endonuclease/exonuclease/phosphatase family metal-dependent hydrolase
MMKKVLKIAGIVLLCVVLLLGGYVAYVFIAYHRLPDSIALDVAGIETGPVQTGTLYTITTYNVGFGAYSRDYSFFMDGGKHAWAYSREEAVKNLNGASSVITARAPDFAFFQEVDTNSTRSYHLDETRLLGESFPGCAAVYAQNYDSPFLFYPFHQPIGKSVSGIVTYSAFSVTSALRRSLPVESGFSKVIDLDRCYSVTRLPVSDGKELLLYNVHLSAYTSDVAIGEAQLRMLFEDAKREYDAGNYVVIGGDFNKDILGDAPQLFHTATDVDNWAKPMNKALIPEGFAALRPEYASDIHPTARDCDTGYVPGVTFVTAIDGFVVSDNVIMLHEEIIDTDFMHSDHNPVLLQFSLSDSVATGGACGKYAACPSDPAVAALLASEPSAPELAAYIKENGQTLDPEDADPLLERLLLLQLDISDLMNNRIWDVAYITALNDTLGGFLDTGKIGTIDDDAVRDDFQAAADSLMTIVRYEETPVFETDWAALEAMKDTFGDSAAQLITYQSRFQGRYYDGDPYNFDLMAGDIAAVEKLIGSIDNGFVRWQLKSLYSRQVSRMLYGAEGEWLFAFSDGDAKITHNIQSYAEKYADTAFGALCGNMLKIQDGGLDALSTLISDSLSFPPGDPRGLAHEEYNDNGAVIEIPLITGLTDAAAAGKINAAITSFAEALVKPENNNQTVSCYMSFANDRYMNFCFSYSYRNESDMDLYTEANLLIDLKTGGSVTLDDLAGKPFEAYQDDLRAAMGENAPEDLTPPVNFYVDRSELTILVSSEASDWPEYYPVTFNGLRRFMDVSKLY